MAGNDVTSPEVTGIDPEVTSLGRMSPGSGRRRPTRHVLRAFELLQVLLAECGRHVTGNDLT